MCVRTFSGTLKTNTKAIASAMAFVLYYFIFSHSVSLKCHHSFTYIENHASFISLCNFSSLSLTSSSKASLSALASLVKSSNLLSYLYFFNNDKLLLYLTLYY